MTIMTTMTMIMTLILRIRCNRKNAKRTVAKAMVLFFCFTHNIEREKIKTEDVRVTCEEQIYSNDYFDFILETNQPETSVPAGYCTQPVDRNFGVLYVEREGLPPLNLTDYLYSAIPKCFALTDQSALEVSGILRMQNQPTLALRGQGVLIGFVDTGERVIIMSGQ